MSGNIRTDGGHGRLGRFLSGLAVAVGCLLFVGGFVGGALLYRPYTIPSDSMTPTIEVNSRVLAERIDGSEVRRGDIVVFRDPLWGNAPMVKRVVGIGGDTVVCCDAQRRLTVNGTAVDEPYLRPGTDLIASAGEEFSATVPADGLFLLGDDRHTSLDSRSHLEDAGQGSVPRSAVDARVDAVVWPAKGVIDRPAGFAALPGGTSQPGPLGLLLTAIGAGALLIFGGSAYGPVARALGRRRSTPGASTGPRAKVGT
ncbi:signal peptidase I [Streptomyces sp. NPDC003327]